MRILMPVHQFLPEHQAGTEIYTHGLAGALVARGHDVRLFYRRAGGGDTTVDGLRATTLPLAPEGNPYTLFRATYHSADAEAEFVDLLDGFAPDLVHIQHLMNLSGGLVDEAKARGRPVVMTLHDYWYVCGNAQLVRPNQRTCPGTHMRLECTDCAAARLRQPWLRALRPAVAALFLQRDRYLRRRFAGVDRFIAPSRFLRERYVDDGFLPPEKIIHLENGTVLERVRSAEPVAGLPAGGRRADEPDQPLRFGFIGSLAWQKGVHVLVDAFHRLAPELPAALWIIGDEDVFPDYAEDLRHDADTRITFVGRVANEAIGAVLDRIDVLVVPSLWFENSPLIIQEAFAAGVPVVASDHGALAEKVHHGRDGLTFTPADDGALADAMHRLVSETGLVERLRAGIRPVLAMDEHAAQLEIVYRELLAGAGGPIDAPGPVTTSPVNHSRMTP